MREIELKISAVAQYGGHSARPNGAVDLKLDMDYSELTEVIKLQQMLNNDVTVQVKLLDNKPVNLGLFRLSNTSISHDGTSKVKLNSQTDFVEMDKINDFISAERFKVRFVAIIEVEDVDGPDEDDD